MARQQHTFAKRKREMDKKLKAEAKRERRRKRKDAPDDVAALETGTSAIDTEINDDTE